MSFIQGDPGDVDDKHNNLLPERAKLIDVVYDTNIIAYKINEVGSLKEYLLTAEGSRLFNKDDIIQFFSRSRMDE